MLALKAKEISMVADTMDSSRSTLNIIEVWGMMRDGQKKELQGSGVQGRGNSQLADKKCTAFHPPAEPELPRTERQILYLLTKSTAWAWMLYVKMLTMSQCSQFIICNLEF